MTAVTTSGAADNEKVVVKEFSLNAIQAAATYDLATATGGDIYIKSAKVYVGTAVTNLTSLSIQTNSTTVFSIMTSTEGLLAGLTADKMVTTVFSGPLFLASTKKIQYTIAGTTPGAGTVKLVVEFMRCAPGADLV